jgi:hypothetical protein
MTLGRAEALVLGLVLVSVLHHLLPTELHGSAEHPAP